VLHIFNIKLKSVGNLFGQFSYEVVEKVLEVGLILWHVPH